MAPITGLAAISFTVLVASLSDGQTLDAGARAVALANASVATSGFPFEPVNPAVAGRSASAGAAFSVGQAHALSALRYNSITLAIPIHSTQVGAAVESFGFEAFRRTTISTTISTSLPHGTRLGVRLTGRNLAFEGYGGRTSAGVSAGWLIQIGSDLVIGGSWRYIAAAMNPSDRYLPQELSFGFDARASPKARIVGTVARETGSDADFRIGAEMAVTSVLVVRAGTGTNPDRISFGFGLEIEPGSLHLAASLHPILGPSMAATLVLE